MEWRAIVRSVAAVGYVSAWRHPTACRPIQACPLRASSLGATPDVFFYAHGLPAHQACSLLPSVSCLRASSRVWPQASFFMPTTCRLPNGLGCLFMPQTTIARRVGLGVQRNLGVVLTRAPRLLLRQFLRGHWFGCGGHESSPLTLLNAGPPAAGSACDAIEPTTIGRPCDGTLDGGVGGTGVGGQVPWIRSFEGAAACVFGRGPLTRASAIVGCCPSPSSAIAHRFERAPDLAVASRLKHGLALCRAVR